MNPGAAPRHTDPRGDSLVKDCPSHSLEAPRHAPPVARGLYSRRNGPRVSDAVTRHRMSAHLLLLLGVLTVAAAAPYTPCNYGQSFVDQCENQCECIVGGGYACTRKGCLGAGTAGIPLACKVEGDIRVERNIGYVCQNGIVHLKPAHGHDTCSPGASWKHRCNTCTCSASGFVICTKIACIVPDRKPILSGGNSIPTLEFGDLAIASERPCPAGLQEGVSFLFSKVCRGQGCTPGVTWTVKGGCSSCVCTKDGEPACTPCRREPTQCVPDTTYNIKCDVCLCQKDGAPACTKRDCTLPKYGDLQVCDAEYRDCPADCGVAGADSYCKHCQCGPRLDNGDIVIGIDEPCPPNFVFKANQWATKTCIPVPQCQYGPSYIDECGNTCDCQKGVYGCTLKACRPGQTPEKPVHCSNSFDLPRVPNTRVMCHHGIVKLQHLVPQCQYGPSYIDECGNTCECQNVVYGCTRKACRPGQTPEKPVPCFNSFDLPRVPNRRVICHDGIVKLQDLYATCLPGSVFLDSKYCNSCFCTATGIAGCTFKACIPEPVKPIHYV